MSDLENSSSDKKNVVSKWNQTRRLEFIDFRLAVDGRLNRADLVAFFNISTASFKSIFSLSFFVSSNYLHHPF